MHKERLLFIVFLIIAAAAARLLPHWPNFTPIAAIALFGGAYLRPTWLAFAVPLAALLVSDMFLGFYPQMKVTYIAFICVTTLGLCLRERRTPLRIAGVTVCGSVLFFLVTNFALWLPYDLYPKNADGLVQSYVAALPFFQNTLFGDLFYTGVLFGCMMVSERRFAFLNRSYKAAH